MFHFGRKKRILTAALMVSYIIAQAFGGSAANPPKRAALRRELGGIAKSFQNVSLVKQLLQLCTETVDLSEEIIKKLTRHTKTQKEVYLGDSLFGEVVEFLVKTDTKMKKHIVPVFLEYGVRIGSSPQNVQRQTSELQRQVAQIGNEKHAQSLVRVYTLFNQVLLLVESIGKELRRQGTANTFFDGKEAVAKIKGMQQGFLELFTCLDQVPE